MNFFENHLLFYTCEVWMLEKPEVVLQAVLQRIIFFISKKFCKEKYSFPKEISTKTSQICDIHERNYIILKYLFQERYIYVNQP